MKYSAMSVLMLGFASAVPARVPRITVASAFGFNSACPGDSGDPAARDELESRESEFQAAWASEAPQLLAEAQRVTGVPFRFREARVALTSCRIPSRSFPLIVNARPYLKAIGEPYPLNSGVYVDTVFHEILHNYIGDIAGDHPTTALTAKYAGESAIVRDHIWLHALETVVYRRLHRMSELDASIADERKLKAGDQFVRSRQIVATEGADAVVADLKTARATRN